MNVPTLRAAFVAALLDESERPAVYLITHEEGFDFGTHWRWERGEMAYTDAGLVRIAERLAVFHLDKSAQIVRDAREAWQRGQDRVQMRWDIRAEASA